jgi:shikimate kinase/3-dehydroquinate synthase
MTAAGAGRPTRPIAISGPMGAGKSPVAKALAARAGAPLVDVDAEVERAAGRTIAQLFADEGEPAFRAREAAAIERALDAHPSCVLALGGGAVVREATRRALLDRAILVTLEADVATLLARVGDPSSRPLLANAPDRAAALASLLAARQTAYAEAHARIDTRGRTVEQVVAEIEALWARDPVAVALGARSYAVEVGAGRLSTLAPTLARLGARAGSVLLVTDDRVGPLAMPAVERALGDFAACPRVILPAGEAHKTIASIERIWDAALDARLDRKAILVALGGGVIGDVTGFAAATLLRGVRVVQLPTTLLAMVDASVGGKTAIDRPQGKNLIGAFHQPSAVIADLDLLATLPARELAAGLAEVVKMAIICDAPLFAWLEANAAALVAREPEALRHAARAAIAHKARVVAEDEHETTGLRATLNFGHTVGHALEAHSGYALLHGEAVALGSIAALRVGAALGLGDPTLEPRVARLLAALGLPIDLDARPLAEALPYAAQDKKRAGGAVGFIVAPRLGEARVVPIEVARLPALLARTPT